MASLTHLAGENACALEAATIAAQHFTYKNPSAVKEQVTLVAYWASFGSLMQQGFYVDSYLEDQCSEYAEIAYKATV